MNINTTVNAGHEVIDTIVYLDQNGQPMLTTPTPDAPPTWVNVATPDIDTMSISADGSTDTIQAVGAGVDTITVTVTVGGVQFVATQNLTVSPAPQVLTDIEINANVQ